MDEVVLPHNFEAFCQLLEEVACCVFADAAIALDVVAQVTPPTELQHQVNLAGFLVREG